MHTLACSLGGFAILALSNALGIALRLPMPAQGIGLRVKHHFFDAIETLGLGLLAWLPLMVWGWVRRRVPTWLGILAYAALTWPVMELALGYDLERRANVFREGAYAEFVYPTLLALCALAVPLVRVLGLALSWLLATKWQVLPWLVLVATCVANHLIQPDDHAGTHGVVSWAIATCAAALLDKTIERWREGQSKRLGWRRTLAAVVVIAALGLALAPPNEVRHQLFRGPSGVGAWTLAGSFWSLPAVEVRAPPASPWWQDRSNLPAIAPSWRLTPRPPVVVLITIDAMRADAVNQAHKNLVLPTFDEIKARGVHFTQAIAPGSQTAVVLTSVFTGRYFSQLLWSMYGQGSVRFAYAAKDPSPRFPELLTAKGVKTASYAGLAFLAQDVGVIRGFSEAAMMVEGRRHAFASPMIDALLARLERVGAQESAFLYVHLLEPHWPYDRGATNQGSDFERYLAEVAVADAQVGRVLSLLKRRFGDRGYLFVSADHGEAFGEHDTTLHTKTLYDELLRIPLLAYGPGIVAKRIDEPVSLMDLGPTLLDLFGVATPATFMGQSLVPWLAGQPQPLTRPIVAEGRRRRALYWGDLKVIEDERRKLVEVYDLVNDPGERVNLFDDEPQRVAPAVTALRAFFAVHTLEVPGYAPPYRP